MRHGASLDAGGASYRLWAPGAASVQLVLHDDGGDRTIDPVIEGGGWYQARAPGAAAGQRYRWRIEGSHGALLVPDPASRWNPDGPHGPSVLVDPAAFDWGDDAVWAGRPWHDAVLYELHVGSFTAAGTYATAAERLPALAGIGITALQLMPLADFPGRFGWGYDGVLPYAPFHGYGTPDDLKRFVQAAHRAGLMVFADVVYNHIGPDGNYLHAYAPAFFSDTHRTAWGQGLNYDGDGSADVRAFVIDNALYWLHEMHFDGLRLDAVHAMRDTGPLHVLTELSQRVRASQTGRPLHLVLENDANEPERLAAVPEPGRYDAQWSGDVHHTLHVLLTGERDGYYAEYDQPVAQLGRALAHGFARQGGPHNAEGAAPRRAADGSAPLAAVVNLLQNHDQIGNRAFGDRLIDSADPAALRLAAAIVMLSPSMPMLFMGEEIGARTPFRYFADWQGELRDAVQKGRRAEFDHFPADVELPDPCSADTFAACKLQPGPDAADWSVFYAELLATRARVVRPLLPALSGGDFDVQGTLLHLQWPAGGAVLHAQVNLSPGPVEAPVLAGQTVHMSGAADGATLGPWSGRWTLA